MADHDELCPQRHQYRGHKSRCVCALLAAARADEREQVGRVWAKREDLLLGDIEVARADERAALNGKLLTLYMQSGGLLNDLAAAEAVAAKLVEVIRVDDLRLRTQKGHTAQARRERDAARAEVERLRSPEWEAEVRADERAKVYRPDAHRMMLERDAARAEVLDLNAEVERLRQQVAALHGRWLRWATVHACCKAGLVASPDPCPWHPSGGLADLRAKVEGLRRTTEVMWDGDYVTSVQLRDVLALLDEEVGG